jgi:hypothetical protein
VLVDVFRGPPISRVRGQPIFRVAVAMKANGFKFVARRRDNASTEDGKSLVNGAARGRLRTKDKLAFAKYCGALGTIAAKVFGLEVQEGAGGRTNLEFADKLLG